MDYKHILTDYNLHSFETLLETDLDANGISSLFTTLLANRGRSPKGTYIVIKQNKMFLGPLPNLTQKMGEIVKASECCLSEVSLESFTRMYREQRKVFLISLFGQFAVIHKTDILVVLISKIRRDSRIRKIIHRHVDCDILMSLLLFNFFEEEERNHKCEDEIGSCQHKDSADAVVNKNVSSSKLGQKKTEKSSLLPVAPRKHHAATLVKLEITVAAPYESQKYKNSKYAGSNTERRPDDEKYPVQETEMDAGQSSFEPSSFALGSSGRLDTLYSEQLTASSYSTQNMSYERRSMVTSGTGIRSNVKHPRYPDYTQQQQRLASFHTTKWAADSKPDIFLLTDCGFFYTGNVDLVRCHQCGIGLKDLVKDDDVLNEHVKYSSECDFLVQKLGQAKIHRMKIALLTPDSQIERDASSNAVQLPYKIRSPRYQTMEARMASLKTFPQHIQISQQELAVSGLFYTGNGDLCRCFTCDGGLKDWTTGDNPVKEHAKYFPNCEYINKLKGREYVRAQQQSRSSNETMSASGGSTTINQPTQTASYIPIDKLTIADNGYSSFHVSQVVQKCGYAELDVITAKAELERKGNKFPTAEEIVNTILDMQDKTEYTGSSTEPEGSSNDSMSGFRSFTRTVSDLLQSARMYRIHALYVHTLVEENERLSQQVYCMLCITSEADILFLPCTHHRICHECAQAVNFCPVCNHAIKEKVKTFRS